MKKGKKLLSFALAAIAAMGIFAGVTLGESKVDAANKTTSEFFSATKNAQMIADYQLSDEMGGYKGLFVKALDNGDSTITLNHELDLRAFSKEDALITVLPVPTAPIEKLTAIQINDLTVRLTDVEDSDIFVEMKVQRNPDDVYPYAGYAQGRGSGQVMTGVNYDTGTPRYYANGNYGRKVYANFYGRARSSTEIKTDIRPYTFAYDYATSSVHTLSASDGYGSTLVADLLDSSNMSGIFQGFKSGKVNLSVTATSEGFNNKNAGFLIVNFAGLDFAQNEWVDEEAPVLSVDTMGYADCELPRAELFCPYPVFSAVAFDKFDAAQGGANAEKTVDVQVRKAGGGAAQVKDGYFTPTETGVYEIVYAATDATGNTVEKILRIHTSSPQNISFAWAKELQQACIVGEKVVVPTGSASGVYGEYETDIKVIFEGKEIVAHNGAFLPEKAGTYEVEVTIEDFLGRKAVFVYYVEATAKQEPVLVSAPSIPSSFYKGKLVSLPDFEAYDYYSLAGQKLEAEKYYVIENMEGTFKKTVVPGEEFLVDVMFGESVIVKYVAKSFLYETEIGDSKVVKIIDNSVMNFKNCFVYENSEAIAENVSGELGMAFTFVDDTAAIHLAGETLFYGLNLAFRVPEEANNYGRIILTITDAQIANRQLVIEIAKTDAKDHSAVAPEKNPFNYSDFYVNGKLVGQIWGNFSDTLIEDFQLKINARGEIIDARGNLVYQVENYLTGEKFAGFSDNLCFVSFTFEEVSGNSAIQITTINDQIIDPTDTEDYVGPAIQLTSSFAYEQNAGTIVLPGAVAIDLIDGRTDVRVEIMMLSTYETVYTGKVGLDELAVSLKKSGSYSVTYYAEDRTNLSALDFILHVYDVESFSVTLQGDVISEVKFGETVSLPAFMVDERLSSFDAVVFVICPKGGMLDVTESLSFVANQTGEYKVYYYVVYEMDNSYSYQLQEFSIVVK